MELLLKGKERVAHTARFPDIVQDTSDLLEKIRKDIQNPSSSKISHVKKSRPCLLASGSVVNNWVIPIDEIDETLIWAKEYSENDAPEDLKRKWTGKLRILKVYYLRRRTEINELNEAKIAERLLKQSKEWYERFYGPIEKFKPTKKKPEYDKNGVGPVIRCKYPIGKNSFSRNVETNVKCEFSGKRKYDADEEQEQPIDNKLRIDLGCGLTTLNWIPFLDALHAHSKSSQHRASVADFKNAPFSDIWNEIAVPGLKVEILNPFTKASDIYWIASVRRFDGYYCLLEFQTFEGSPGLASTTLWINFCSDRLKPLGWAVKNEKKLHPGKLTNQKISQKRVQAKLDEWDGMRTIPEDRAEILTKKMLKIEKTYNKNGTFEALDIEALHQNRLCKIIDIIGNRILVKYIYGNCFLRDAGRNMAGYKDGFWFDCNSEYLHPFMWSYSVGVSLNGVDPDFRGLYKKRDSFPSWPEDLVPIDEDMKLETRHPFLVDKIVSAEIINVLNYGYFMIETRDLDLGTRSRFIHHVTSAFIFPVGWGHVHGIEVEGFQEEASSNDSTESSTNNLRLDLLPQRPKHNFAVGNHVEAVDIKRSRYLGPATVEKVAGHMLLLKFKRWEGYGRTSYQWVDAFSSEIYPIGYTEIMLNHRWHGCEKEIYEVSVSDQ